MFNKKKKEDFNITDMLKPSSIVSGHTHSANSNHIITTDQSFTIDTGLYQYAPPSGPPLYYDYKYKGGGYIPPRPSETINLQAENVALKKELEAAQRRIKKLEEEIERVSVIEI